MYHYFIHASLYAGQAMPLRNDKSTFIYLSIPKMMIDQSILIDSNVLHSSNFAILSLFIVEVTVKYIRGLPHVVVPLPSRNEKCQFALRPVTHNVGDFLQMLLAEDKGIDRAAVLNEDGVRIAAACSIESLLNDDFW